MNNAMIADWRIFADMLRRMLHIFPYSTDIVDRHADRRMGGAQRNPSFRFDPMMGFTHPTESGVIE